MAKTPECVKDLDETCRTVLQCALEMARAGPTVYHRRGSKIPSRPWTPPEHVEFDHPELGKIEVHVETAAVYKKDLKPEEKVVVRRMVEAKEKGEKSPEEPKE